MIQVKIPEIKLVGITTRTSNAAEMNPLTAKIATQLQKYFTQIYLFDKIKEMSQTKIGRQTPFFKTTAVVNGEFKPVSSDDYRGKYLIVFFYPRDLWVFITLYI